MAQQPLAALDTALLQLNADVRLAGMSRATWPPAALLGAAHRGINQSSIAWMQCRFRIER